MRQIDKSLSLIYGLMDGIHEIVGCCENMLFGKGEDVVGAGVDNIKRTVFVMRE